MKGGPKPGATTEMICPQCKAEYRPGFTRCADCDVDLVWEPHYAQQPADAPAQAGDPNEDPFCSFWKGDDARVHAELCGVLDEAGISHNTVFRRDHLFNLRNNPAFELGVPFSLFEKAENEVKEAFGTEDDGSPRLLEAPLPVPDRKQLPEPLPEVLSPPENEDIPGPPNAGEEFYWYPEDATVSVWSSENGEPGDFVVAALHENRIRCRVDKDGSKAAVYVLPEDEPRARALVREVVEGKPPE